MPKRVKTINQFHGGLNNHSSRRDIAENELTKAQNISVDDLGKVKLLGGTTTISSIADTSIVTAYENGYGLFHVSNDYPGMEDCDASGVYNTAETEIDGGVNYTIVADAGASGSRVPGIYIYSDNGSDAWGSNPIRTAHSSSVGNFKALLYSVDGVLRIKDANIAGTRNHTGQWLGYIKRDWWGCDEGEFSFDQWYLEDETFEAPTAGNATTTEGVIELDDDTDGGYAEGAITIIAQQTSASPAGTWDFSSREYKFYVSYIYEGGYDGPLITDDSWETKDSHLAGLSADNRKLLISIDIGFGLVSASEIVTKNTAGKWFDHFSPRIKGIRLYYTDITGGTTLPRELYGLAECYFDRATVSTKGGLQKILGGANSGYSLSYYNVLVEETPTNIYHFTTRIGISGPPEILTYEDINGYHQSESIHADFKTAVVAGRKLYVGNIKQDGILYGDMMVKSPVNGFDIIPQSRSVEVTVRDGDEIIKLEAYADRILQFKRNKMHLINVSQEIEFLEDTYMHKGVSHPASVAKTDFGIVWANRQGCFLYDGRQVTNLLEKGGRKIISDEEWVGSDFITGASIPMVAYLPDKRQIIVCDDVAQSGGNNIYLYDMVTGSWVYGLAGINPAVGGVNQKKTNFSIDSNDDLVYSYIEISSSHSNFEKWNPDPQDQDDVDLRTKSFSFTNPTQRKKIYKVYVTHKYAGDDEIGLYGEFHSKAATSGQEEGELSNDFFFGFLSPDIHTGNYVTQEFTVPTTDIIGNALSFNSVYTMRLYLTSYKSTGGGEPGATLDGTVPSGFAVNDISVVYRIKGMS